MPVCFGSGSVLHGIKSLSYHSGEKDAFEAEELMSKKHHSQARSSRPYSLPKLISAVVLILLVGLLDEDSFGFLVGYGVNSTHLHLLEIGLLIILVVPVVMQSPAVASPNGKHQSSLNVSQSAKESKADQRFAQQSAPAETSSRCVSRCSDKKTTFCRSTACCEEEQPSSSIRGKPSFQQSSKELAFQVNRERGEANSWTASYWQTRSVERTLVRKNRKKAAKEQYLDHSGQQNGSWDKMLVAMNQAINQAARAKDVLKAEALFNEVLLLNLKPDAITYNSVIHACARSGDLKRAEHWLSKMRSEGIAPTNVTFNILMDVCAKQDNMDAAESYMCHMRSAGIKPNEVAYGTLIHARARQGCIALAEEWLETMIADGVDPNIVNYNCIIVACSRTGDLERAEKWMAKMEEKGCPARVTTYTAVVDVCAKAGKVVRAQYWMKKMMSHALRPSVVSFSAMIDACAKAGDPVLAEQWYQEMLRHDVQPNAHCFSAMISASAKVGDASAACKCLLRMREANVLADVVVYGSVLDACAKALDSERASDVFHHMLEAGIRPNVVAYTALACPLAHAGDWTAVEKLAQDMALWGIDMNDYFLYQLLMAYANSRPREGVRAEVALRDAHARGIKINKHVQAALARAMGRNQSQGVLRDLGILAL